MDVLLMISKLTLGAYWDARGESIEQCRDRLYAFMHGLTQCGEVFSRWFVAGRSRRNALEREIDVHDRQAILDLLDSARNRNFRKEVIEDLGFHPCAWNGRDSDSEVTLSITCGLSCEAPGLGGNNVVIELPSKLGDLADPVKASRVLAVVARCWEPKWAGIFSSDAMNLRDWEQKPFVDWMVYVPRRISSVPTPSTVAELENGGSLIVVQPSPPAVDKPEDQERIHRIEQIVRP